MQILVRKHKHQSPYPISEYIDLESLAFQQAGHLMSNKQCKLPQGTLKRSKKGYEEISVPALKPPRFREDDEKLVSVKDLPEWVQPAFERLETLIGFRVTLQGFFWVWWQSVALCTYWRWEKKLCNVGNATPKSVYILTRQLVN